MGVGKGEEEGGWWGKGKGGGGGREGEGEKGDARGERVSDPIGEWRGLVMGFPARAEMVGLEGVGGGEYFIWHCDISPI